MLLSVCTTPKTAGVGSGRLAGSSGKAPSGSVAIDSKGGSAGLASRTSGAPSKSKLVTRRSPGPRKGPGNPGRAAPRAGGARPPGAMGPAIGPADGRVEVRPHFEHESPIVRPGESVSALGLDGGAGGERPGRTQQAQTGQDRDDSLSAKRPHRHGVGQKAAPNGRSERRRG